ncbi:hypothetical protein R3P38DRAFT_1706512 [Favolaschia claudopus]|uniref:DUF6535 domain-containing protein n=1 Tax=Favolaschia claudopus TaxID=2862362 RepID=A0AAW0AAS8_9AGAR
MEIRIPDEGAASQHSKNLFSTKKYCIASDARDDAAAAKIWAIYAAEAEKYDKGLVQSWKSDMDGMLIFAGLFSAVLTAFLIESYKTLNPDPVDLTVLLLTRISEQLADSAHGNATNTPLPLELGDGGPTRAALACNALWFLSLGLSLSCALIATLLEQWAREFLHRTDIHSAPVIRARIFSFLYHGLRRFNMHAIVDIIPLLLHLSLMLFFSGLVAFLIPVNTGIAIIAAVMLFVVATTYSVLTVFPLRYLDSPYRTPLTGLFWKLYQYFRTRIQWSPRPSTPWGPLAPSGLASETMVAAISRVTAKASEQRASRDLRALVWTVKSLADNTELEPFVDAISDVLWGPQGRRKAYHDVLHHLVNNPQTVLHTRIIDLYCSCDAGILTPVATKRRKIICYKAMWTTIPLLHAPHSYPVFPRDHIWRISVQRSGEKDLEVMQYASSVEAMVWWRLFENDKIVLNAHLEYLQRRQATSGGVGAVDLTHIKHFIRDLVAYSPYYVSTQHLVFDYGTSSDRQISTLLGNIRHILTTTPYIILLHYLQSASMLDTLPYSFRWTVNFLRPSHRAPSSVRSNLDITFGKVVPRLLHSFNSAEPGWMDSVMNELVLAWLQQETLSDGLTLHPEFLRYLNDRRSEAAVSTAMKPIAYTKFWEVLANTLETTAKRNRLQNSLTAAWRLVSADTMLFPPFSLVPRLLDACMGLNIPSVPPSLIAVFKSYYMLYESRSLRATDPANAMHRWLATIAISSADAHVSSSTAAYNFSTDHPLSVGDGDAFVVLFAEYLEDCARSSADSKFPHDTMTALHLMNPTVIESFQIHETHQIRFANALKSFFGSPACGHLRFTIIADTWLFRRYLYPETPRIPRWLDNPIARDSVIATLTQYIEEMAASAEADTERAVVRTTTIVDALRVSSQNEGNSAEREIEHRVSHQ